MQDISLVQMALLVSIGAGMGFITLLGLHWPQMTRNVCRKCGKAWDARPDICPSCERRMSASKAATPDDSADLYATTLEAPRKRA